MYVVVVGVVCHHGMIKYISCGHTRYRFWCNISLITSRWRALCLSWSVLLLLLVGWLVIPCTAVSHTQHGHLLPMFSTLLRFHWKSVNYVFRKIIQIWSHMRRAYNDCTHRHCRTSRWGHCTPSGQATTLLVWSLVPVPHATYHQVVHMCTYMYAWITWPKQCPHTPWKTTGAASQPAPVGPISNNRSKSVYEEART